MPNKNKNPFAYFITLRTYNTWVHGDSRGSVDPNNNIYGTKKISPILALANHMRAIAKEEPFAFSAEQKNTVLNSSMSTCEYNHWNLFAAHIRSNHAHFIIQTDTPVQKVMGKIKCYGTKALKTAHQELSHRQNFWAYHGSTVNIWAPEKLFPAMYYVVKAQGEPMALYYNKKYYDPADEAIYEAYFI
jgi:REP element-mobilizing transposase RayT